MKRLLLPKDTHISETLIVMLLLAVVGGFTDSYTFHTRDGVLANAQTGNTVFLGINLIDGNWTKAFYNASSIIAFFCGVLTADYLKDKLQSTRLHWKQWVILVQMILLIGSAFIPMGRFNLYVNLLVSYFCALQVEAFRLSNSIVVSTTMCTGNLRSGTSEFYLYLKTGDKAHLDNCFIYLGINSSFIIGVILGTFLSERFFEKAIFFCCFILFIVFIILFAENREMDKLKNN